MHAAPLKCGTTSSSLSRLPSNESRCNRKATNALCPCAPQQHPDKRDNSAFIRVQSVSDGSEGLLQPLRTAVRSKRPDSVRDGFQLPRQEKVASELHQALADEWLQAIKAPPELREPKAFVFVRHGHSTWNQQSRIQGNTDESELTDIGRGQAIRAREALQGLHFDSCFSSPHTRARQSTEIVWELWQQQNPDLVPQYLPSLSEVDLGWFQGLRNEDIAAAHPELYRVWREEPERFMLDGRYPVLDAFRQARRAWSGLLAAPGGSHLVITHKSLLRALLCTALGLPPRQFRAIDLANGAICMVRVNKRGDMMLSALNLTSHLLYDGVRYQLPELNKNDKLAAAECASASMAAGSSAADSLPCQQS